MTELFDVARADWLFDAALAGALDARRPPAGELPEAA
jgi:hypothetical protein